MEKATQFYATGRRKSAIARTWLMPGEGKITINDRPFEDYFVIETIRMDLLQPMVLTNTLGSYNVRVRVTGGGITGQAGAIRHGLTRALIELNPDYRPALKKAGFVRRDPRAKERKKYGQKSARARFQFSKR